MTREELFEQNKNLVYYCVKKLNPPDHEYEDCVQEGLLGLWKVCGTFDESKGFKFATYAVPSIDGIIRRYLREKTHSIKIPRSLYFDSEKTNQLENLLTISSLDFEINEAGSTFGEVLPEDRDLLNEVLSAQVTTSMIELVVNEFKGWQRNLLEEFYYDQMFGEDHGQEYYAKKYKKSQSYVSRVVKKFRERLKKEMEEVNNE